VRRPGAWNKEDDSLLGNIMSPSGGTFYTTVKNLINKKTPV
jgi:hypothetical protein